MKFRKNTTFNTHDTKFEVDGDRLIVSNGVKKRCELVLNSLLRKNNHSVGIASDLATRFKDGGYTVSVVQYVLRRLVNEGLVRVHGKGPAAVYSVSSNVIAKWRASCANA
jgi:hypothetical protein